MNVFYLPEAEIGSVILSEEESKHCVRVLRMQTGDNVCITNGNGLLMDAVLVEANPKHSVLNVTSAKRGADFWPYTLHLGIAPTKNIERIEWFLEKVTEIGIDEISLFSSMHSERKIVRHDRLEKIIVSAVKQSIKSRLPKLNELCSFNELVRRDFTGSKYIAWIDETIIDTLVIDYQAGENVLILIGPEGDFSREEVDLAKKNGFKPISLGSSRLRTETAGIVACNTIQFLNQLK
jgi:16S rRNA (uracil1498-N3)-methyltransferase